MIGENDLPDLNLSAVLLFDFCANNSLFKTSTIFEYKVLLGLVGALEVAEGSRQASETQLGK